MSWFKFNRGRKHKTVDATAEIEAHTQNLTGDRGQPDLSSAARPMAPGAKGFFTIVVLAAVLIAALLVNRFIHSSEPAENNKSGMRSKIENVLPELKLAIPTPPPKLREDPEPAVPDLAQVTLPGDLPNSLLQIEDPIEKRRLQSGLKSEQSEQTSASSSSNTEQQGREQDSGPLADSLRPLRLNTAQAGLLGNRDLLLTQGAMIDCVQQTKFVSAQAGMITCYSTREVRSANGRVVLIDPGTMFVGYQQGVLAQGQPRIGVVWSRLETPNGVVVHLDSPGTGSLGEAGLDGEIDTHFAQRFGGAIMVSLMGDIGNWLSNKGNSSNGESIRFDSSSDAAQQAVTTVLDNTINIPPTLYRNQGGRVGIYVARDLDFSSVYALRPTYASNR